MLKKLNAQHQQAIELLASGLHSKTEIANCLGVNRKTIYLWLKDDLFMTEYYKCLRSNIQSLAAKAIRVQTELLTSKNDQVRYLVSKDILDRAEKYGLFKQEEDSGELNKLIKGLSQNG